MPLSTLQNDRRPRKLPTGEQGTRRSASRRALTRSLGLRAKFKPKPKAKPNADNETDSDSDAHAHAMVTPKMVDKGQGEGRRPGSQ